MTARQFFKATLPSLLFAALFGAMAFYASTAMAAAMVFAAVLAFLCLWSVPFAVVLLVAAMLFSPEIRPTEGIILRAEDLILPTLAFGLILRGGLPGRRLSLRVSPIDAAVVAVLVVNVASSVRGVMQGSVPVESALLWNGKIAELFMVYWVTFNYVRTPTQAQRVAAVGFAVFLVITLYASAQIPTTEVYTERRLTAPFEGNPEPSTLGGYLNLMMAILLGVWIHETRRRRKLVLGVICALTLAPLAFTLSRTTYIAFAVMLLLLGAITRRPLFLAISLAGLCFSPFVAPQSVVERMMSTFDSSRPYGFDPSLTERVIVWRKALYSLQSQPLLGRGVPQQILDSQWARIIIESGLCGLATWVAVMGGCIRVGLRLMRKAVNPLHKGLATGYVVGTIALLTHSLATITFYIVRIMEPFWLLTGLIFSLDAYYQRKNTEELTG